MKKGSRERLAIDAARQALGDLGYRVGVDEVMGSSGQIVDIVAMRPDGVVLIEVKTGEHLPSHALNQLQSARDSWRVAHPRDVGADNVKALLVTNSKLSDSQRKRYEKRGFELLLLDSPERDYEKFKQVGLAM